MSKRMNYDLHPPPPLRVFHDPQLGLETGLNHWAAEDRSPTGRCSGALVVQCTFSDWLVVLPLNLDLSLSLWLPPMGLKGFPLPTSCSASTKQPNSRLEQKTNLKRVMDRKNQIYCPAQQINLFLNASHKLYQFMNDNVQLPPHPSWISSEWLHRWIYSSSQIRRHLGFWFLSHLQKKA